MSIENNTENWAMLDWTLKNLGESVAWWKEEPEFTFFRAHGSASQGPSKRRMIISALSSL